MLINSILKDEDLHSLNNDTIKMNRIKIMLIIVSNVQLVYAVFTKTTNHKSQHDFKSD
jgi:hypothetical protein